jgi:cephalosporin-C deacetylase
MPSPLDFPLEQLQTYHGTNPCPDDLDTFWERQLSVADRCQPAPQWQPASFQSAVAACFDLTFTSIDGSVIYVKALLPRQVEGNIPAILEFHGYGMNSGDWNEKLSWVSEGAAVFSMDSRGQGGRSQDAASYRGWKQHGLLCRGVDDGAEKHYLRHLFLDAVVLAKLVGEDGRFDSGRLATIGRSQGGGMALACASLVPHVSLVLAMCPFLSDYKRVWEMDLTRDAYADLEMWLKRFSPTGDRHDELFALLGYFDVHHLAKRIRARVLMGTGLSDLICPPSTQFAIYNQLAEPKEMVVFPQHGHELMPGFWDRALQLLRQWKDQ